MLVLTRKASEQVLIAGNIRLTILEIRGDRVRIGVAAPLAMRVDRGEIHARKNNLSRLASAGTPQVGPLVASAN